MELSPAQQEAFKMLMHTASLGNVLVLYGAAGLGKTTVLREAHCELGGVFLNMRELVERMYNRHPLALEEAFQQMVMESLAAHDTVIIDDSDVIFESGEEMGLYRYLLTMLDGLESESAARVCVMMTAMDVGNLPPAMIRSGRIELWLEMSLPDAEARATIISAHLSQLPASLAKADLPPIVSATEGFSGADLKRLIEDGKTLYAYDKAQGRRLSADGVLPGGGRNRARQQGALRGSRSPRAPATPIPPALVRAVLRERLSRPMRFSRTGL
jgi:ATP-dependent 26S proteasome regulatory subunit